jgi:hypothetical protein
MDEESSFILASASNPNIPAAMQNEPGFEGLPFETPQTHQGVDCVSQPLHSLDSTKVARNESLQNMNIAIGDFVGFLLHYSVEIDQPKEYLEQTI